MGRPARPSTRPRRSAICSASRARWRPRPTSRTATPTGGCLYFTFAGQVDADRRDAYYRAVWDAGQRAVLAHGGALSHHHGVGLNRAAFVREALGPGFDVLAAAKAALDPHGILNPGQARAAARRWAEAAWP